MSWEDPSAAGTSYENVVVEVASEEIVTVTDGDGDPSDTVTIEVTVINDDGTEEYIVAPMTVPKRTASGYSEDEVAPKRLAIQPSTANDHVETNGAKNSERDVIISIGPNQLVDDDEDQSSNNLSNGAFKCFLCGNKTKFGKWSDLLTHFNSEHCSTEGLMTTCKCPTCGLLLTLKQEGGIDDFDSLVLNALSHMVREHDYSDDNVTTMTRKIDKDCAGKISCEKCGATVRADYMKKHLAQYCKGCKRVFDCKCGKRILPGNIPNHANVCAFLRTEKACTCPECGLIFKTVHNMELHFRRCHLKESRYSCEACGEKFFKRDVLVQHAYVSHNINMDSRQVLVCSVENCDFTAIYAYHLNQHIRRQHERGPFVCERCDKTCNTYYTLNRHHCVFRQLRGRRVTSHVSPVEKKTPYSSNLHSSAASGARLYKCSECNFTNASRKRVELHGRIHRDGLLETDGSSEVAQNEWQQNENSTDTPETSGTQEFLYCCGECGLTSEHESVLREHLETGHGSGHDGASENTIDLDTTSPYFSVDTASLPHQDAEAVNLLNHFRMNNTEGTSDAVIKMETLDSPDIIYEMVQGTEETNSIGANPASDFSAYNEPAIAASAIAQEVVQVSLDEPQVQNDPSILPKKSTTLAKNAPRLFHELTKSGSLMKSGKKTQTIVRPVESLQEYNIVFQSDDDHPTPPGQIILLSPEDAAQLMIRQQSSDAQANSD